MFSESEPLNRIITALSHSIAFYCRQYRLPAIGGFAINRSLTPLLIVSSSSFSLSLFLQVLRRTRVSHLLKTVSPAFGGLIGEKGALISVFSTAAYMHFYITSLNALEAFAL